MDFLELFLSELQVNRHKLSERLRRTEFDLRRQGLFTEARGPISYCLHRFDNFLNEFSSWAYFQGEATASYQGFEGLQRLDDLERNPGHD